jgi:hypothetical protein
MRVRLGSLNRTNFLCALVCELGLAAHAGSASTNKIHINAVGNAGSRFSSPGRKEGSLAAGSQEGCRKSKIRSRSMIPKYNLGGALASPAVKWMLGTMFGNKKSSEWRGQNLAEVTHGMNAGPIAIFLHSSVIPRSGCAPVDTGEFLQVASRIGWEKKRPTFLCWGTHTAYSKQARDTLDFMHFSLAWWRHCGGDALEPFRAYKYGVRS